MNIHKSHNATVEMAIADFFYREIIPDAVVESPRFKRLVRVCRLVGDDFVVPNHKKVGEELLDINYENTYSLNIRSTNQYDNDGTSSIVLPCPGS